MMALFGRKTSEREGRATYVRVDTTDAIRISQDPEAQGARLDAPMLSGFLAQLVDEELASHTATEWEVSWDALFEALEDPAYRTLPEILGLPPITSQRPHLQSHGALVDEDFEIALAGWSGSKGAASDWSLKGGLLEADSAQELLSPAQWALVREVRFFALRGDERRSPQAHRLGWARLRKLALAADAVLDDFLLRTVVLSPEKLRLEMRRSTFVGEDRLVEILPQFEGAPPDWLNIFDARREVSDRYDIVTEDGIVQVLVSEDVKVVLQELKRTHRRVAGQRAQAFLMNPYATLGEAAAAVIDEAQFEQAKEAAGLHFERFTPVIERDSSGYPEQIGLLIECATASGPASSEQVWFDDVALEDFLRRLKRSLEGGFPLVAWEAYELEILGDSPRHYQELTQALEARRQPQVLVRYAEVYDLSIYSARVEGLGVEKPYYSAYIAKKRDDDGWFPENVLPVMVFTPDGATEPSAVPLDDTLRAELKRQVAAAEAAGADTVTVPGLPRSLGLGEAKGLLDSVEQALADVSKGAFSPRVQEPDTSPEGSTPAPPPQVPVAKKTILLKPNIERVDYDEIRSEAMRAEPGAPVLPAGIRAGFSLLDHQRAGLAWMQHLYRLQSDYHVRGAVLADDMGLGKTFQLLALMAYLLEHDPGMDPMLVVAPVSLLENWAEEAQKFFVLGALPMLTAYGEALAALRVPKAQVDIRLRTEDGLVNFLKPGWVGHAKVVLTTYETLRDLEVSFAAQRWSLMVCDEAQRIKNPAAMVTRAAKKQNAAFRIACTGTPVENTLADLWCLFDFVQPGLLGSLNEFGRHYRRPIEAKDDDVQQRRVEELREKIDPQILRRMKKDVAKDLPRKVVVEACQYLPLSDVQRSLYARAIDGFRKRHEGSGDTPFKNHLGLLQYLRLICTDPRPYGLTVFRPEVLADYRRKSPKLHWLLDQLGTIKAAREKAIVFCEFKEIQRLLQHYIREAHGYSADIINGDASTSVSRADSRQKRIKNFQAAPGFGVLILSPVAVGFGVNIQAANHVIHFSRTWNPAKEDQATDRAYRIGATKDVYVYYPVVRADDFVTFDVKLHQLLTQKRELADDMLNGASDVTAADFNIAEVVPEDAADALDERVTLDTALRMDWRLFECLIAVLWSKQGFQTYRTPGSGDNGVDVVALQDSTGTLLQVKSSGSDSARIGWEAVQEVVTGRAYYARRHPGVAFKLGCVSNAYFSRQAEENAALNDVTLVDRPQLDALLQQYPVTLLEVERLLHASWESDVS